MRKRAFSLLELLVALSLFTLLISSFFYFTNRNITQAKRYEKIREPLVMERYLSERIERMLTKIKGGEGYPFYSDGEVLHFAFDNGVSTHPKLSSMVQCEMALTKDVLCCTLHPLEKRGEGPILSFPLLDKIDSISFTFYQPPDDMQLIVQTDEVSALRPHTGLHRRWERAYQSLPASVTLTFVREGETRELTFDLDYPILLKKEIG